MVTIALLYRKVRFSRLLGRQTAPSSSESRLSDQVFDNLKFSPSFNGKTLHFERGIVVRVHRARGWGLSSCAIVEDLRALLRDEKPNFVRQLLTRFLQRR